jgi:hypothetical protein
MTKSIARPDAFHQPDPSFTLMRMLGVINRWVLLRAYFRIRDLDFPHGDRARLRSVVNEQTAAFIAPNHPEFGLDWMMDKEISTLVAPRVACWASHGIVASAPWFWTRNNLVANNGGEAAKHYSIDWAMRGHGVLLHPEGSVRWTSDTVHPLFHGIAEMAVDTARSIHDSGGDRPTYIVPIVWKYRYTGDVSVQIHREIETIERAYLLPSGRHLDAAERFYRLQLNILDERMTTFGFAGGPELDFFARQQAFQAWLVDDLVATYAIERADSIERTIERIVRAIRHKHATTSGDFGMSAKLTYDLARAKEAHRLGGFSAGVYVTPRLSQEQMFESLKRLRASLLVRGFRNTMHNYLPTPYGPRIAHIRVPEPIVVDPVRASSSEATRRDYVDSLTELTRSRMQQALGAINHEIANEVDRVSHANPFFEEVDAQRRAVESSASSPCRIDSGTTNAEPCRIPRGVLSESENGSQCSKSRVRTAP